MRDPGNEVELRILLLLPFYFRHPGISQALALFPQSFAFSQFQYGGKYKDGSRWKRKRND